YFALAGRQEEAISSGYPAAAEEAGGQNLISVLLVDIRAWDTMGEISVLAAAAAGVASLMFVRRSARPRRAPTGLMTLTGASPAKRPNGQVEIDLSDLRFATHVVRVEPRWDHAWLPGAGALPTERRSLFFEVVSRFLFPVVMVISVYL